MQMIWGLLRTEHSENSVKQRLPPEIGWSEPTGAVMAILVDFEVSNLRFPSSMAPTCGELEALLSATHP